MATDSERRRLCIEYILVCVRSGADLEPTHEGKKLIVETGLRCLKFLGVTELELVDATLNSVILTGNNTHNDVMSGLLTEMKEFLSNGRES